MRNQDYQQSTIEETIDWPFLDMAFSAKEDCYVATIADAETAQLLNQFDEDLIRAGKQVPGPRMLCKSAE
jgi:hypothetical protein